QIIAILNQSLKKLATPTTYHTSHTGAEHQFNEITYFYNQRVSSEKTFDSMNNDFG
ncbi:hypothetical protein MNBD_BACTEROID06-1355, partial [hydrothermal vent metagenome]